MIGAGLFDGGGLRRLTRSGLRHENTQLRHELATVTAERDQLAAGIGRANTRAEEAEQRALTAEAEFRRIAGRPCGPDAETTVPMRQPDVPALRDVAAELGCGTPLRDTDPEWCSAHQSARKPTQACERPVPLWEAPFAKPGPDAIDTAELHVVAVPYHDPANPAA